MRLGRSDEPEGISAVFAPVPAELLSDFTKHGYSNDPVLKRMVGLFVEEVEPISGAAQIISNPARPGSMDPFSLRCARARDMRKSTA
jgi:hypothetical protein